MPQDVEPSPGDTTPLGPLFDALEYGFDFEVGIADRLRAGRLLQNSGNLRDLPTLRLALASIVARSPDQRRRFFEGFDLIFEDSLRGTHEPLPSAEDDDSRMAALRILCESPTDVPSDQPTAQDAERTSRNEVTEPEVEVDTPRPDERPRTGLTSLRIIPWPSELPRPRFDDAGEAIPGRYNLLPEIDPAHPEFGQLDLSRIGCQVRPMLSGATLGAVADALGYFTSGQPSLNLDVRLSVEKTAGTCAPTLCFEPSREVCRVLVLQDLSGETHDWNTVPQELIAGLTARGIPVSAGTFRFSPESFQDEEGRTVRLEDLDGTRTGWVLLVVSTGGALATIGARRILEDLSRWPRVAWLDPREERFWDGATEWVRKSGLPVFEATGPGLLRLAERLISERGHTPLNREYRPPATELMTVLRDDAFPWACACALMPRIAPGIAESLRRTFFSGGQSPVPSHALGRLYQLPGASHDREAIQLTVEMRKELLTRGRAEMGDSKWSDICRHLIVCLDSASRDLPRESVARFVSDTLVRYLRIEDPRGTVSPEDAIAFRQAVEKGGPLQGFFASAIASQANAQNSLDRLPEPVRRELEAVWPRPVPSRQFPEDMAFIPGGPFRMGDGTGEGYPDETPEHEVELSEYAMGRHPVTNGEWNRVRSWAIRNGYRLESQGDPAKVDHPVVGVSWTEAVVWCNARSEMEGRRPAYYTGPDRQTVCRSGNVDVEIASVDWEANGYRLPTEAEWERAARGGKDGHHYPWESRGKGYGRFIRRELANYNRNEGGTTPVNKYPANEYGLHDMAGNVWEWCWDWLDLKWYSNPTAGKPNPRGPSKESNRVIRGGGWAGSARLARCAYRNGNHPSNRNGLQGFRLSLGAAGLGLKAAASEARRDDERKERRRQTESRGCLVVRVPAVPGVQLRGHGPKGGQSLEVERPQGLAVGRWKIVCEAPGYQPTELEVEVREGEARALALRLEREIPKGFEWIPAGTFWMGDPTEEGWDDERPRHPVEVSEFWMGNFPVTNAEWAEVRAWALQHGYELKAEEDSRKPDHPIVDVDWYEAVRWCNARSEKEGRRAVYYAGPLDSKPEVLRRGTGELSNTWVDWAADGYRLPTEAEWEKAARGGRGGHHYPWESQGKGHERFITKELANYGGNEGGTTPLGRYRPNDYGLHDMAGNVWEWCWDRRDNGWYANPAAQEVNPHGPPSGTEESIRVCRGGSWANSARFARCAYRTGDHPSDRYEARGFRLSLGHLGQAEPAAGGPEVRRDDEPTHPMSGGAVGPISAWIRSMGRRLRKRGRPGTEKPRTEVGF